jgi:drug/metabolite transporter (DMT)-like permease
VRQVGWSALIGDALALASAFVFAIASIAIAKAARNQTADNGVLLSILMTGILSALAWCFAENSTRGNGSNISAAVGWFAASGLLATVWGRQTLFKAVQLAGVIRATTIRRLTPFFSALLAWAFLGETISGLGALGMVVMAGSFALLYGDNRQKLAATELFPGADIPRGYMIGAICALMYAASYVVRKQGLETLPDPYFGAMVGSAAALVYYLAGCLFSPKFRADVGALLSRPDRWQFVAAFCISLGQILQFLALNQTGVGRVAIINSVEIFISSYLAVMVFKTEEWPSALLISATVLATAGVIFVAAG